MSDAAGDGLRAGVYLAVGCCLLLSPAAAGPVGDAFAPESTYTYEAVEVTAENDTLAFDGPPPDDGVRGIDCLASYSRLCGLERAQLDGNVTAERVNPIERRAAPFVEFDDQYYRRVHEESGDTVVYGLRPVPARTVLAAVAVPVDETTNASARRDIVAGGTATVDRELDAPGQVVSVNESYYVFNFQRAETPRGDGPRAMITLGATVGFLFGLWSLRRGWLAYDDWRGG